MKLLVVSNGFPPRGQWGTEYYTYQLVTGLQRRGHDVTVLHPEREGSEPRYTLERTTAGDPAEGQVETPVYLVHNTGDPKKSFADSYENERVELMFAELLRELKPDVVHFTYLLWGLSVRLPVVCRDLGIPSVLTLTDYSLLCHRGQMFDWTLNRCEGPHPPSICARCIREPGAYDEPPMALAAKRFAVRSLAAVGGLGRVVVTRDLERRVAAVRAALDAATELIAPTRVLAEAFRRFGVDDAKLTTLCYAIDARPFELARRPPPRPPVLGFLGQFTPHKGLGTLMRAARIMAHRLPESVEPWEIRLHGSPSGGRSRLYAQAVLPRTEPGSVVASAAGAGRVVVHAPFAPPDAPEVFAGLSAVLLPSEWDENAPLTCLQARAAGVPIVASDVGGIAEIVEHGKHGLLFPAGDAEAMADAMRTIILGRFGRHSRTGEYALPSERADHLDRIEGLYAKIAPRT